MSCNHFRMMPSGRLHRAGRPGSLDTVAAHGIASRSTSLSVAGSAVRLRSKEVGPLGYNGMVWRSGGQAVRWRKLACPCRREERNAGYTASPLSRWRSGCGASGTGAGGQVAVPAPHSRSDDRDGVRRAGRRADGDAAGRGGRIVVPGRRRVSPSGGAISSSRVGSRPRGRKRPSGSSIATRASRCS